METFKDCTWLIPFFVLESRVLIGQAFQMSQHHIISANRIYYKPVSGILRQTDRQLQKFIYIMSKLLSECSRCDSPVTDALETEIEQYGKAEISTKMDVSYPANLIGTFRREAKAKAHMMAYDKQLKDFVTMYDEEAIL